MKDSSGPLVDRLEDLTGIVGDRVSEVRLGDEEKDCVLIGTF